MKLVNFTHFFNKDKKWSKCNCTFSIGDVIPSDSVLGQNEAHNVKYMKSRQFLKALLSF